MASVFVVDSTFKRTQIKVTPGRYLREVLEEACKSRKLDPEAYSLKTQTNKVVDLSQPFRLSGLTPGAKVQLVQASRSPSVVSVALQLPEADGGTRLSDKFPSNVSLWLVLRKFEEGVAGQTQSKLNLTQQGITSSNTGSGRLSYRQPCVNAMGRSLETFADLQKTLGQLGFNNGSVLMRLSYKDTERPLEEAMSEISQYFDTKLKPTAESSTRTSQPAQQVESMPTADIAVVHGAEPAQEQSGQSIASTDVVMSDAVPANTTNSEPLNTINGMSVYLPSASTTPAAALHNEHESVFEPSIDDARAHQASLTRAGRNTRLLSDKELEDQEAERNAKLSIVQEVGIRVRFPDQSMIETTVYASEVAADLHKKVRDVLRHPAEPFELRYAGVKGHQTLPDESTKRLVKDFGFRGKVLVTLIWKPQASLQARKEPSLQDHLRSKAQELKVNLEQQSKDTQPVLPLPKPAENASPKGKGKVDVEAKMKKFLGFGKK